MHIRGFFLRHPSHNPRPPVPSSFRNQSDDNPAMAISAVALPPRELSAHPLRKNLWLAAGALSALVLTIVVGNFVIDRHHAITSDAVGHDFLAFYTAGHFLREGHPQKMYDLNAVRDFQKQIGHANHLELRSAS